jgi:hypothetical protein
MLEPEPPVSVSLVSESVEVSKTSALSFFNHVHLNFFLLIHQGPAANFPPAIEFIFFAIESSAPFLA